MNRAPMQPRVFISAVSAEFASLRQEVAKVVHKLGYQPVSMDDWATGHGELRAWLRQQIDSCDGLIHIPGMAYGAEPTDHDPAAHGLPADTPRYSYTQYEFLYAQQRGIKTWVITPGPGCTRDHPLDHLDLASSLTPAEATAQQAACRQLQRQWLQRLKRENHIRHKPKDDRALQAILLTLTDHAAELRQKFGQWQTIIDRRGQRHTRLLTGILVVFVFGVWKLLPQMKISVRQGQTLIQGQDQLAAQLSQIQEKLSDLQRKSDPTTDPISKWSQDRLETELARAMNMDVAALRAILRAGKTSLDALLQGQALLAFGQREEAGKKFDTVISQEQSAMDRLRSAYEGKAQIAYDLVKYQEALGFYQKAAGLIEKRINPLGWATAQADVAYVLDDLARYDEAEPLLKEVLRLREQHLPSLHCDIASALNDLAQCLKATNRMAKAEPLYRRGLKIDEAIFGRNHPTVAIRLNNLALLLGATNRRSEAEPLLRRALEIDEAIFGPDHPTVAIRLNNFALLLRDTNRLAEAWPLMERALEIDEAGYGPDHPEVAKKLGNLGLLLRDTNRLDEAERLCRRALKIDEASFGPDHPNVARDLNNLAQLLHETNRTSEAEPLMQRALKIDEASFRSDHPNVANTLNNLAQLLQSTNRHAEAEPLMRRALKINEATFGPDHPDVAIVLNNLAGLLQATNRLAEAEPLMQRALKIDEVSFGPDHPDVAIRLSNLAGLLMETNRLSEAEPLYRRALKIDEASFGPDHPNVAKDLNNLATLYHGTNRLLDAELLSRRAARIIFQFRQKIGHDHPNQSLYLTNYLLVTRALKLPEAEARARLDVERQKAGLNAAVFENLWQQTLDANKSGGSKL